MKNQNSDKSPLLDALNSLRPVLVGVAIFSFFTSILMLTGPLYMLQVYDRVLASGSMATLVALTLLILMLYTGFAILDWARSGVLSTVGSKFEDTLSDDALASSYRATFQNPNGISGKSLQDLRVLRKFVSGGVAKAIFDAPYCIVFFSVLFAIHWTFGTLALAGAILLTIVAYANQYASKKATIDSEQKENLAQHRAREMMANAELIEALGMQENFKSLWRAEFDGSDSALVRSANLISGFTSGAKSVRLFLQSLVLGLGAYLTIVGLSTPGAMIAASIITGRAIAPIEQLVGQWRSVTLAQAAWRSLDTQLRDLPAKTVKMELPPIKGHIAFERVSAGPPRAQRPFLKDISFSIEPGDALGIIGPSASGKSTLLKVMTGVWSAQIGDVRFDGAEISTLPRAFVGPQIGYLPQQVNLFAGTVQENIARFEADATAEQIIEASMAAGCHDMILRLSDGYETDIGQQGLQLSAGQRQRIGLARALFRRPAIVILDEPNANLDHKGDDALQSAVLELKSRLATTVIVGHRPSAIEHCNKLIILEDGRMRAFGNRDDVLAEIAPKRTNPKVAPLRASDTRV